MNLDELLDGVARRAGLESRAAAERATLATLETLGEHVSAGEAEDIAAKLPDDIAESVTDRSDESPEEFSPDEFVRRVVERENASADGAEAVDDADATVHVRAVMATLADAGLENELQDAHEQLPNEFAALFETDELAG